jgi:hypothetical protein
MKFFLKIIYLKTWLAEICEADPRVIGKLDFPNGLKLLLCELGVARARAPVRAPPSSHSKL